MSAIESLKTDIKENWELAETSMIAGEPLPNQEEPLDEDSFEELQDTDRKVVKSERKMKNFQQSVLYVLVLLIFIWLTFFVVLGITSAPNDDMSPNVRGGDLLFFYRIDKTPSANEVIVFEHNDTRYVGRVLARPGDTVEIAQKGGVIVNGNNIVESRIYEGTLPREGRVDYPLTLGDNQYFVLVDSREDGEDSRFFGPITKSEIKGTVIGMYRRTNF